MIVETEVFLQRLSFLGSISCRCNIPLGSDLDREHRDPRKSCSYHVVSLHRRHKD